MDSRGSGEGHCIFSEPVNGLTNSKVLYLLFLVNRKDRRMIVYYTNTHTHTYMSEYICVCVCMCACVCKYIMGLWAYYKEELK
jgi:hypothetical protein